MKQITVLIFIVYSSLLASQNTQPTLIFDYPEIILADKVYKKHIVSLLIKDSKDIAEYIIDFEIDGDTIQKKYSSNLTYDVDYNSYFKILRTNYDMHYENNLLGFRGFPEKVETQICIDEKSKIAKEFTEKLMSGKFEDCLAIVDVKNYPDIEKVKRIMSSYYKQMKNKEIQESYYKTFIKDQPVNENYSAIYFNLSEQDKDNVEFIVYVSSSGLIVGFQ